jgi:hypothetical protein
MLLLHEEVHCGAWQPVGAASALVLVGYDWALTLGTYKNLSLWGLVDAGPCWSCGANAQYRGPVGLRCVGSVSLAVLPPHVA